MNFDLAAAAQDATKLFVPDALPAFAPPSRPVRGQPQLPGSEAAPGLGPAELAAKPLDPAAGPFAGYVDGREPTAEELEQKHDREAVAKELASSFEVLPANHKGPRKPNQLTPEEYAKVVATYSDIRRGKSDLQLDDPHGTVMGGGTEEAEAANALFKQQVMKDITSIMQTPAGREMIFKLSDNKNEQMLDAEGNPEHRITRISASAERDGKPATISNMTPRAWNTVGEDATATYTGGRDGSHRDLFHALTKAVDITTGTFDLRTDGSAMEGGRKLNGRAITDEAYDRERRGIRPR